MTFRLLVLVSAPLLAAALPAAAAQSSATLTGRVLDARAAAPIAGAHVVLDDGGADTTTAADGAFAFERVAPGPHHLHITADRFAERRIDVTVAGDATLPAVDVMLDPEMHYAEVVSVSPAPRDVFESYQPTSVLSGQELSLKLETSLGELLKTEPGVAVRSNGPGPSRPVIRGLDGDRVLILENGQRTDDLSSQSADHGVAISPLAAQRVEVVRGPATLLYGANAIGGLVNVVTDVIPTKPVTRTEGALQLDVATASGEVGGAGDITVGDRRFALHAGGSSVRNGDMTTPRGEVPNSQARSAVGHVGASITGAQGFVGASYQYDESRYGIPYVEEGETQLTPRRHTLGVRGQTNGLNGVVDAVRGSFTVRRYRHDELDGEEIATQFENDTVDVELMATTKPIAGRIQGTYGASGFSRSFDATGEEALSPPVDQRTFSAFTYQEATWSRITLQGGARVEHTSFTPSAGLEARDFTNVSGSAGLLLRTSGQTSLAVSLARAVRNPALEELYFLGPHVGNFAFEVGDASLAPERALGLDVSYRWRLARASGEVSWFRNAIDDYVLRNPTGEVEDDLPVVRFTAADALLQGVEAHTDVDLTRGWTAEAGLDYVRGSLRVSGDPLPRIPPLRVRGGLRYRWNAFQAGAEVVAAASQERVFGAETPTDGYGLLKAFGVYAKPIGHQVHTITVRVDNATNETYFNHLSFIKALTPEMGRTLKVVYGVRF